MSESKAQLPSDISREAKGLNLGLQAILKSKDPWERDVEFQRKNLRRQYVRLIFVHPYAKESKDAETRLWMQSSYAFITLYKHRIARADPSGSAGGPRQGRREAQGGVVEYRKLLSRFRQFLAEEEKFWTQLIVRIRRSFGLDEVHASLVALELIPSDVEAAPAQQQAEAVGRGQNIFPVEDESVLPSNAEQRRSQLSLVSKALVCLGDIARYKEQYNDKGGRPKAGQEMGPPAKKNGKKQGGDFMFRSRDYEKAQQRYEHARALVPSEGNASHQMAILASYQRDTFGSLVHYYRALCVQQPYETAAENMDKALSKALDHWKSSGARRTARSPPTAPRLRIDDLKERIVVLHAYWANANEEMPEDLPDSIVKNFSALVSERLLPLEIISKIIILTQGVIWKHRMLRPSSKKSSNSATEAGITTHLLAMHRSLLEVGAQELGEAPPDDSEDPAQSITATFRRTIPALRMASKWIRANFIYFASDGVREQSIDGVSEFWEIFARFSTALERIFPLKSLPRLTTPLEEDWDVRGFLPLTKLMTTGTASSHPMIEGQKLVQKEQVHPNEEQLMRLWDLLTDARVIAENQESPILCYQNQYFIKGNLERLGEKPEAEQLQDVDDDVEASRTDDDPVSEAFRRVLDGKEDDDDEQEEDEIVWDPRVPESPNRKLVESDSSHPQLSNPVSSSPRVPISLVPTHVQVKPSTSSPVPKPTGTTAQDLLNNVMGLSNSRSESATSSPLLFGSAGLPGSSPSIWSTSLDNPTYTGINNHHQRSRSQYAPPGSPFLYSHLPPGSSQLPRLSNQIQTEGVSTAPPASQPHPIGHHRIQSASFSSPLGSLHNSRHDIQFPDGNHSCSSPSLSKTDPFSDPTMAALHASPNFPLSVSKHAFTQAPASSHSLLVSQLWNHAR